MTPEELSVEVGAYLSEGLPGYERPLRFGYDRVPEGNSDWNTYDLPGAVHVPEDSRLRHLSVCGLHLGSLGRCCPKHSVCGEQLEVGDVLQMKYVVVPLSRERQQRRIGVYLSGCDENGCLVGFIDPSYYECAEVHNAMISGLSEIQLIRFWRTNNPRADNVHGGAADCVWIIPTPS